MADTRSTWDRPAAHAVLAAVFLLAAALAADNSFVTRDVDGAADVVLYTLIVAIPLVAGVFFLGRALRGSRR